VYNDPAEIEQDPMGVLITIDPDGFDSLFLGQLQKVVGHGSNLTVGGPGGDNEIVRHRRNVFHIEHNKIGTFVIGATTSQFRG